MRLRLLAPTALTALGLIALLGLLFYQLDRVVAAVEWLDAAGPLGDVGFLLFYVLGTLVLFPASWNTGAAGYLYGPLWGTLIASVYGTLSAAVAFTLGRTVLRHRVRRQLERDLRYAALDQAIARRGLAMVTLLRASPFSPYNPLNYLLSATGVSTRQFVLGTWLGGLLPSLVWAQVGASVDDLRALFRGEVAAADGLQLTALAVTLAVSVPITWMARATLREARATER